MLELQALKMSRGRHKEKTLEALKNANEAMVVGWKNGDLLAVARADIVFHRSVVENCGNQCLRESYELISGRLDSIRTRISLALGDVRTRAIKEHQAMIGALEKNNVSRARAVLSLHISKSLAWFDMACKQGLLTAPHRSVASPYANLSLEEGGGSSVSFQTGDK